jgi:hypothetical protein
LQLTIDFVPQSIDTRMAGAGRHLVFRQFDSLLATIAVYYSALLLITCVVITRLNRHAVQHDYFPKNKRPLTWIV